MISSWSLIEKPVQPQRTTLEGEQTSIFGRFLQLLYLPYCWWYKSCSSVVQNKPLYNTSHWVFTINVSLLLYQHPDFNPSTTAISHPPFFVARWHQEKGHVNGQEEVPQGVAKTPLLRGLRLPLRNDVKWQKIDLSEMMPEVLLQKAFQITETLWTYWCSSFFNSLKFRFCLRNFMDLECRLQTRTSKRWGIPAMAVHLSWTRLATRAMPKNTCECQTCGNTTRVEVTQ